MGATRNSKLVLHKDTIKRLTGAELQKAAGGCSRDLLDDTLPEGPHGTNPVYSCTCISVCASCNPLGGLCA